MSAKKKNNPGVPVIAMNPAPGPKRKRKKTMAKKRRRTTTTKRKRNPGNPSNPRRRTVHRRRRRHNPSMPGGAVGSMMRVGLVVVGGVLGAVLGYALKHTNLEPKTAALVEWPVVSWATGSNAPKNSVVWNRLYRLAK